MRLLVVTNLAAGPGDGAVFDFLRLTCEDGDDHTLRCTDGTTDVRDLVHDAADYDAVVVAGGDGTIATVAYHLAYSGVPIMPFPAGTANLLANNLRSPYEPHALAKMIRSMRTLDFDLGEIEKGDERFGFAIMAGAGYDAAIMHGAKPTKKMLGSIAYFQAAVANVRPQKSTIRLTVDDRTVVADGLGVIIVNLPNIQFEIPVTHGSDPRDGEFDVAFLKTDNAFGLIPAVIAGIRDRDGEFPSRSEAVEVLRGKSIHVSAKPPMIMEFDGELPDITTPFSVRVLHKAARFIVSEEGFKLFGN